MEMVGLEKYYKTLSSTKRDMLISLVSEAMGDDSLSRGATLDAEITELRRLLDEKFRQIEALKERLSSIEGLLADVPTNTKDCELFMLRGWLVSLQRELKARLAELRPDDDLRRKRELMQRREELSLRMQAGSLISGVLVTPARGAEGNGRLVKSKG